MSIRNLDALFHPNVIAVVGASNRPGTIGATLAANLFETGFAGPILSVNPHEAAIRSTLNYRSVAELPLVPDLAVLATPPETIPGLIAELGAKGCRAAVIVTAGFGEGENAGGEELRLRMLTAAQPHLMRLVGPNCLGFLSPPMRINASFAHLMPPAGTVALVTQSGAVATALIDWAAPHGIGFSHVVSLGDMADVDFGDLLDYLALDRATRAILLYAEAITHPRKFMSAARIAARVKPVIVVKSGRSAAGAHAALSHTGALAGSDIVYDAAFRRAGMLRVTELREVFEAVTTLASGLTIAGDRLAIITNGGGLGVMAADALAERHGRLADLSAETLAKLDAVLPKTWSHGNPVDIVGDANGERYRHAVAAIAPDRGSDALLVINCPTAVADSVESAKAVIAAAEPRLPRPLLACWVGEGRGAEARQLFLASRIPAYETPDEAVRAFGHLVEYRRNQEELLETPPAEAATADHNRKAARAVIDRALSKGRHVLSAVETKTILAAYGVPVVKTSVAATPEEVAQRALEIGGPVALKILSPQLSHKSDVGGVRLDVAPAAAAEAAVEMAEAVRSRAPDAALTGFTVEPMIRRPAATELLLGLSLDQTFGPVVLFGQGGTAAEAIGDRAVALPPLNLALARQLIARTRVYRLLQGFRERPAAALDAIAGTVVRLAEIAIDLPEIVELDINPLVADEHGVIALDARAGIRPASQGADPADRLAIRPYPTGLEKTVEASGVGRIAIRPIKPQDEAALSQMVMRSTLEDVRLRFFQPLKEFPHALAARFSQIDYDREMALVATPADQSPEILGVARLAADPDNERAEYAVMVRSDLKGHGIGYRLMQALLDYARKRGIKVIFGEVLRENGPMLQMVHELGFATVVDDDDPAVLKVSITP
jgi:acetyltransferase